MNFKKSFIKFFTILIVITLTFFGCSTQTSQNLSQKSKDNPQVQNPNILKIHYIDVGQGDCILVQINNKNMLIDAGPAQNHSKIISYLKNQDIKKIHYFITTHPHEDHIGGASYVIDNFCIEAFYAPKKISSTKTYKKMISSLRKKKLKIHVAKAGVSLNLGKNTICEMLSPNNSKYEDTNNYSPIMKLAYKNKNFIFTGDAEALSEQEVLSENYDISADVLKVGHHGSVSSTSIDFLKNVNPKIAVISCGKNNKYGHPHKETLSKLKGFNCKIYRTDLNGDILISSDGNNLKVKTSK
ncbi:ComEC/Rec2 family competence protein [Haloimpatiens sp. FM7330]|uniref:ComEC/Rec2 family competence protein n=1 Tax=Haloimpatiens sp. FM7330 TaxID=3298610 RepID=UPI003634120C